MYQDLLRRVRFTVYTPDKDMPDPPEHVVQTIINLYWDLQPKKQNLGERCSKQRKRKCMNKKTVVSIEL